MGIFEKKSCDICGKEIGFLGNRKCKDGNMCKACARKLSPWFRGRKKTSIEKIKKQLDYRAENKKIVKKFTPSRTYGTRYRIMVDDDKKALIVSNVTDW